MEKHPHTPELHAGGYATRATHPAPVGAGGVRVAVSRT